MFDLSALRARRQRPLIMGIVNVTPDSFSGDGTLRQDGDPLERALAQARRMGEDGADILDIGGESTRPGADPVTAEEEKRRIIPVLEALRKALPDTPLSVDTMKPAVAEAALAAGVSILNDISGAAQDPAMRRLAAESGASLVLMHNKARADEVRRDVLIGGEYKEAAYGDVVDEVVRDLEEQVVLAQGAGVGGDKLILDPGLGFGKTPAQNRRLVNRLDRLTALGFPVLVAASRKSFIGRTLNLPPEDRLEGTAAVIALATLRGAALLRVHDVLFMTRVAQMASALAAE